MSRLTSEKTYCETIWCPDVCCGSTDNPAKGCYEENLYNKLREYEFLEEQGRLISLAFKVGDVVYSAEYENVKSYTVTSIRLHETAIYAYNHHLCIGEVGMSVFATKAEAEKALAEMEK